KGKLGYSSPEQVSGEGVDRRTDIFAAGIVLWEALTMKRLFVGEHEAEVVHKLVYPNVTPPRTMVPDLPQGIDEIVLRALSSNPKDRYPTALAMAEEVEAVLGMASARAVGDWVQETMGDVLVQRAARVKRIEKESGTFALRLQTPPPTLANLLDPDE